ncbi:MAG TPA: phage tail protein [Chloroflexota bacterium]
MDANGTRFHLLLGEADWAECVQDDGGRLGELWASTAGDQGGLTAWDRARSELTLKPQVFPFVAGPMDRPPRPEDRRGAAGDRYGNLYWIAESGRELRVRSAGTGASSHFWSPEDGRLADDARYGDFGPTEPPPMPSFDLGGLAVTEHHYLVVGVLRPAGLLIFDLHAGGGPRHLPWPEGVPFVPFDMAPAPGGGLWVLDRENARYWALDRRFEVVRPDLAQAPLEPVGPEDFQPTDGAAARRRAEPSLPPGIDLEASSPLAAIDPFGIEGLPDGTVLILDRAVELGFSRVFRYRLGQPLGRPASTEPMRALIEESGRAAFRLVAHDMAFAPADTAPDGTALPERLYLVGADGNQSFAFALAYRGDQLLLDPQPDYLPMRLFGGKGLCARGTGVFYDFGDGWLPLVEQRRPRFEPEAFVLTPPFDGRDPACVWHRLILEGSVPPEAELTIWSRAADEAPDLEAAAWQPEPRPYRRGNGSELPFAPTVDRQHAGAWELLFQRARGRFLQLRLRLAGDGRATPRLRALRAYYPRFSYLEQYLPAVYRDDDASASFLDRFLANLEGFYTGIEDRIAAAQLLFDVRSAPTEALDWLAGWLGVALDPAWDERRRRLFIRHAMRLFQYRGTIRGLEMALRLALDEQPDETIFSARPRRSGSGTIRFVERFRLRRTPATVLGDPTGTPRGEGAPPPRWTPRQGGAFLHERYRQALGLPGRARFPARDLGGANGAWRSFASEALGFVPSATAEDEPAWRDFVGRRYRRVGALNRAYGGALSDLAGVRLPRELPRDGAALQDWYLFEGAILPMRRLAHRFSVLLPTRRAVSADEAAQRGAVELARRIVELEKPAHTVFDLKFYWALFRVGEARLGEDTLIDLGGRSPELLPPLVVGHGYLAETYLAPNHPQDVPDRPVLGRDRLADGHNEGTAGQRARAASHSTGASA